MLANILRRRVSVSVREAIRTAIDQEMAKDPNVFLIGEEVGQYDGAYKVSKGLLKIYGEKRIVDTPITEAGFTGLAVGASLMGLKPVVEFMTWNFALQSIDQIVNSCAKIRCMSAGKLHGSIVFRGINGPSAGVAAQHSQCFAAWYGSVPGLKVVTPYDAADALGLLKSSIRDPNPVVFLESEMMYSREFDIPEADLKGDFTLPIGKAHVQRAGKHVTVVAYARMVDVSLKAADVLAQKGIEVEVINLRTIRPLDRATIIESVKKTNHLVTVEDGWPQSGIGAELCAVIFESEAFDYLDAPVERLTAADVPLSYSKPLEDASFPRVENVVAAVERSLYRKTR